MISNKKVEMKKDGLYVPDHVSIPFIEGDGIGVDIWAASSMVLNSAVDKAYAGKRSIDWIEVLAGEKSYNLNYSEEYYYSAERHWNPAYH